MYKIIKSKISNQGLVASKNIKTNSKVDIASTKPGQIFKELRLFLLILNNHLFIKEIVFDNKFNSLVN